MADTITTTDEMTSSVDLRRMVAEAQAAGFNPLTVLRSGLGAGFATQRIQTTQVGGGSFTSEPSYVSSSPVGQSSSVGSGPQTWSGGPTGTRADQPAVANGAPPPPVTTGPAFDPSTGQGGYDPYNGTYDDERAFDAWQLAYVRSNAFAEGSSEPSYGPWEAESEFNMAVAQLRMRNEGTGNVVTDDGRVIATRPEASYQGGMFNPITYTGTPGTQVATTAAPGQSAINPSVAAQFQPVQVWEVDKLPKVVSAGTFHPLAWGLTWEEVGGSTRGETVETVYGEDNWLAAPLLWPKVLQDVGQNFNRLDNWAAQQVQPGGAWSSSPR